MLLLVYQKSLRQCSTEVPCESIAEAFIAILAHAGGEDECRCGGTVPSCLSGQIARKESNGYHQSAH